MADKSQNVPEKKKKLKKNDQNLELMVLRDKMNKKNQVQPPGYYYDEKK